MEVVATHFQRWTKNFSSGFLGQVTILTKFSWQNSFQSILFFQVLDFVLVTVLPRIYVFLFSVSQKQFMQTNFCYYRPSFYSQKTFWRALSNLHLVSFSFLLFLFLFCSAQLFDVRLMLLPIVIIQHFFIHPYLRDQVLPLLLFFLISFSCSSY